MSGPIIYDREYFSREGNNNNFWLAPNFLRCKSKPTLEWEWDNDDLNSVLVRERERVCVCVRDREIEIVRYSQKRYEDMSWIITIGEKNIKNSLQCWNCKPWPILRKDNGSAPIYRIAPFLGPQQLFHLNSKTALVNFFDPTSSINLSS